jgi:hypothetical protein
MRPQSLPEKLLLAAAALSALVAFPNCDAARASAAETEAVSGPEAELLSTTGDCPDGVALRGGLGEPIVIELGGFGVQADLETPRSRALCSVTVKLHVPRGLMALVAPPEIRGVSGHTPYGSATLSVRWFTPGAPGDEWFKKFAGDVEADEFRETPPAWEPRWYACGESPELTLLADATARVRPTVDAPPALTESLGVAEVEIPAVLYRRCAADL